MQRYWRGGTQWCCMSSPCGLALEEQASTEEEMGWSGRWVLTSCHSKQIQWPASLCVSSMACMIMSCRVQFLTVGCFMMACAPADRIFAADDSMHPVRTACSAPIWHSGRRRCPCWGQSVADIRWTPGQPWREKQCPAEGMRAPAHPHARWGHPIPSQDISSFPGYAGGIFCWVNSQSETAAYLLFPGPSVEGPCLSL